MTNIFNTLRPFNSRRQIKSKSAGKSSLLSPTHKINCQQSARTSITSPLYPNNANIIIAKNENILIINDDLFIKDIDSIMTKLLESNFDLVGLNLNDTNSSNGIIIREKKDYMGEGFGCFLFLKKNNYVTIPNDLKVWYGDRILFENNKNIGEINFDNCIIEISKTVRSSDLIKKISHEDKINYSKYKAKNIK